LVIPNKRIPTTLGAKMAQAPFFGVEGVAAKKAPLVVAYMDVGERCEQERKLCSSII
jgi:hypothetical protein